MIQHKILFLTSNIGSLFENGGCRKYWLSQITKEITQNCPSFVALHLQESGGKNYKLNAKEMPSLVDELQKRLASEGYVFSRCFLDIQCELIEEFTALSSLFFIHESAVNLVHQFNFKQRKFIPIFDQKSSQLIITAGLNRSGFVRKEKFSRDFWPSFRFGRKGFLHTRWKFDESNNRKNAFNYVLQKFEKFNGGTIEGTSNLFVFGDFNFRLDFSSFVKKLTRQTNDRQILLCPAVEQTNSRSSTTSTSDLSTLDEEETSLEEKQLNLKNQFLPSSTDPSASSSETDELKTSCDDLDDEINETNFCLNTSTRRRNSIIEYYKPLMRSFLSPFDGQGGNVSWVLRVGRKRFEYFDEKWLLSEWRVYREDDCELNEFPLKELFLQFPPTYPWSEEPGSHNTLMKTRAPAWCDRILFNNNACNLLNHSNNDSLNCNNFYRSFAMDDCIGDHKPVLLLFSLPTC
uniref:inositol-polyphosphate 5-phosphatase n=1 Tax=Meloidogyne hapla TaxID=6305 RepID=A0A1I8BEF9_MELHA